MLTYTPGEPFNRDDLEVTIRWDHDSCEYTFSVLYVGLHISGSGANLEEVFEIAYREACEITEKWEAATKNLQKIMREQASRNEGKNIYAFPSGELVRE